MNDQELERLSAFLDGELDSSEVLQLSSDVAANAALRQRAALYNVIGAAMRAEAGSQAGRNPAAAPAADSNVIPLSGRRKPAVPTPTPTEKPARGRWWQPLSGLAVAASVATLAVVMGQWVGSGSNLDPAAGPVTPMLADSGPGALNPGALNPSPVTQAGAQPASLVESNRDSLMMASDSPQGGVQVAPVGLVPFVRMVDTPSRWQAVSREELYRLQQPGVQADQPR